MDNISVLLAEDDLDTQFLIQTMLELAGFTVTTANNGAEALDLLQRIRPDVILTDLMMPRLSGIQLITQLRSSVLRVIPIVAMTAHGILEPIADAQAAGADVVLRKPLNFDQLIATLTNCARLTPCGK